MTPEQAVEIIDSIQAIKLVLGVLVVGNTIALVCVASFVSGFVKAAKRDR